MMTRGEFWEAVSGYCMTFSGSVTSGHRSVERNRLVGGVRNSAHMLGLAADVVYDGSPPGPEADAYLVRVGIRRLPEGDHDHLMPIDFRPA